MAAGPFAAVQPVVVVVAAAAAVGSVAGVGIVDAAAEAEFDDVAVAFAVEEVADLCNQGCFEDRKRQVGSGKQRRRLLRLPPHCCRPTCETQDFVNYRRMFDWLTPRRK